MVLIISTIVLCVIISFILAVRKEMKKDENNDNSYSDLDFWNRVPTCMHANLLSLFKKPITYQNGVENPFKDKKPDVINCCAFIICFANNFMLKNDLDSLFLDYSNTAFLEEKMGEIVKRDDIQEILNLSAEMRDYYSEILELTKETNRMADPFFYGGFYIDCIYNLGIKEKVLKNETSENDELPNYLVCLQAYTSFAAMIQAYEKSINAIINFDDFKIRYKHLDFDKVRGTAY